MVTVIINPNILMKIFLRFHEINPPSALSFVLTPIKLLNKNAIINTQNKDDKSFLYATAISVYYDEIDKKHPNRILITLIFHYLLKILTNLKKIILIFLLQYLDMVVFIK